MAFRGNQMFIGQLQRLQHLSTSAIRRLRELIASVVCPGGQGDVSVHGNLLFMSVEQTRGRIDCGTGGSRGARQHGAVSRRARCSTFTNISKAQTARRGPDVPRLAHAHAHRRSRRQGERLHLRIRHRHRALGGGTGRLLGSRSEGRSEHRALQHRRHPGAARGPRESPASSARPRIFADPDDRRGLRDYGRGAITVPGTQKTSETNQCHDITVFPEVGLAAGACSGNGILLDISDPVKPVRLDHVVDKNFAYWHSATFNNDGTKVIFTDEWGGGTRPRCRRPIRPHGAPTRSSTSSIASCSSRAITSCRRRRPSSRTVSPTTGRSSRFPAATSWSRAGTRVASRSSISPIRQAGRDRVLRSRPGGRGPADHRGSLVGLLVQRRHLRGRDRARHRRPAVEGRRAAVEERSRCGERGPPAGLQRAAAAASDLAGDGGCRRCLSGPVDAQQWHRTGQGVRGQSGGRKSDHAQLSTLAGELEKDAAAATGATASRLRALAATIQALK